jgi:lincosamide nucleotidyltransferase A/C/D/E
MALLGGPRMRRGVGKRTVLALLSLPALAWLLLSARRYLIPAARAAYLGLERSPLGFLLRFPGVQWLKSRVTYIPESRVLALMNALDAAGVSAWVAGGWGIDALIGHQTRRHYDLDLVVSDTRDNLERMEQVLARAGFRPAVREFNPGLAMPLRHNWQDDTGHTVEVMPVAFGTPPFTDRESSFTRGVIGGHLVPCLSARLQVTLHAGYEERVVDVADMEALRTHVNQAEWAPPG